MAHRGFAADAKNCDLEYAEPAGDMAQDAERERRRIDRRESKIADAGRRQQCPEDSRGGENVDRRQGDLGQDQRRARGLDRYRAEHQGPSAGRAKHEKNRREGKYRRGGGEQRPGRGAEHSADLRGAQDQPQAGDRGEPDP